MEVDIPSECNGYKVVKLKCEAKSDVVHYLYMREHSVREMCEEKPSHRTLFILGTPPFVREEDYRILFSKFGVVEKIYFHPSPCAKIPLENISKFFEDYPEVMGYKVAYIVFKEDSSVRKIMNLASDEVLVMSSKDLFMANGLTKWCREYNSKLMDVEELQQDIDEFMSKYDKAEEEAAIKEKVEMQPDDEGWTKVTKRGRKPGFARKESVHNKIMKKEDEKKKKKHLVNFYKFQIKESKMNQLVKLREKFEEDKKKIAELKQSRMFRPF